MPRKKGPLAVGAIHSAETLFMRNAVGTASSEAGNRYDVTTAFGNSTPIIQSKQTGKFFTLSWQEIIELAIKAGIDD